MLMFSPLDASTPGGLQKSVMKKAVASKRSLLPPLTRLMLKQKYKLVSFEGETLFQGLNDKTPIYLLRYFIPG